MKTARRTLKQPFYPVRVLARAPWSRLRRLAALVQPYVPRLTLALAATALFSALSLIFPSLVGRLVDGALLRATVTSGEALNRTVLLLLLVFVGRAAAGALQSYLLMTVGESVVVDVRVSLYRHLLRLPQTFFDRNRSGSLTSRLSHDVLTVQSVVSDSLSLLVGQAITLLGGLIILLRLSPRLSLVMVSVIPFVLVSAALFGKRLERATEQLRTQEAGANAHAQQSFDNVRVVKSFGTEGQEGDRYEASMGAAFQVALRRARVRATYGPVVGMLMACSVSLVLWSGGHLVQEGRLSAGTLIAFLLYTVTVTNAMSGLSGVYGQIREAVGASAQIFSLLDQPAEPDRPAAEDSVAAPVGPVADLALLGGLRFENVSFQYQPLQPAGGGLEDLEGPARRPPTLDRVSFEVRPGQMVALVGPSGGGKSTVAALIPRLYEPVSGQIVFGGRELSTYPLPELRRLVGSVPQETQLFAATLRENLSYGTPGATAEQIEAAAVSAHVHAFASALPQGYDTLVGERGMTLSGGQRQRVAIARALLKNPRLLILDEATSALDSESERLVQEALDVLMHGRTTLVIAHRLSTIRRANLILVMDAGRVVQGGTHEALMNQPGLYRLLQQQQEWTSTDRSGVTTGT